MAGTKPPSPATTPEGAIPIDYSGNGSPGTGQTWGPGCGEQLYKESLHLLTATVPR